MPETVQSKKNILSRVKELLYPVRCCFCGRRQGVAVCGECAARLKGLQLPAGVPQGRMANAWMPRVVALWEYSDIARHAVLSMKKFGTVWRLPELRRRLCTAADEAALPPPDMILAVPTYKKVARSRPVSVPELLADGLAEHTGVPHIRGLLVKIYDTSPQHTLPAFRRHGNLVGCFEVTDPAALRDKTVWLVDDVTTTGATLNTCARLMWMYGARQTVGLCLCTPPDLPHQVHKKGTAAAGAGASVQSQ